MDRKIIIVIAVLMAASCSKQVVEDSAAEYIRLDAGVAPTKALIESSSALRASGNELTLYDVHTKADGTLFQYMTGQKVTSDGSRWGFVDGSGNAVEIPWTKRGFHHFLAYVSRYGTEDILDKSLTVGYEAPGEGEDAQDHKIVIPAGGGKFTITPSLGYDFMYASAARNVVMQGTGTVQLKMKHLFAAVTFQIQNMSGSQMTINSFELDGMRVTGSAVIGHEKVPVITLDEAPDASGFDVSNQSVAAAMGSTYKLHGGDFLIWPHISDYYADLSFSLTYTLGSGDSAEPVKLQLTTANPKVISWDAGCRYIYTITISDQILFDVVKVVDWINDDVILQ